MTIFTYNVVAAPTTVLGSVASSLRTQFPSTPAWSSELSTASHRLLGSSHPSRPADATTINQPIGYDGTGATGTNLRKAFVAPNPASYDILAGAGGPYASHYDPVRNNWLVIAGTTGNAQEAQTLVRYNVARDEFRHWQGADIGTGDGLWPGWGYPHNFGGSCIDLVNNRLWRLVTGVLYGNDVQTLGWISLLDPTVRGLITQQQANRFNTFTPIRFMPGLGTSGSIIALRHGGATPRAFYRFDIASSSWDTTSFTQQWVQWDLPTAVDYQGSIYWSSSISDSQRGFYRINQVSPTVRETLDTPPVPMNAGAYYLTPYNTELAAMNGKIYAFTNLDNYTNGLGAVYVYDIVSNAWSGPVDTAFPYLPDVTGQNSVHFTVTAVEAENVILMARLKDNSSNVEAFVWKP